MPIAALVLRALCPAAELPLVCDQLRLDPRLTLGELHGDRIPAVLDSASLQEGEEAVEALTRTPGIGHVDVVMIDFSDVGGSER